MLELQQRDQQQFKMQNLILVQKIYFCKLFESTMIKQESYKSTKSKDDGQRQIQLAAVAEKWADLQIKLIQQKTHQQNEHIQPSLMLNCSDFNSNQGQIQKQTCLIKKSAIKIQNKNEYLESLKISYKILGDSQQISSEKRKKQKLIKKSFGVPTIEESETETENDKVKDDKIKEILKSPMNIDIKKLESKNSKLFELSGDLQFHNGKFWQKCTVDIDLKTQQLVVSNLHLPFSTIEKIKIYKPNADKEQNFIKVTYVSVKSEETLLMNMKNEKLIKKLSSHFLIFEEILVQKLKCQNRFEETKWQKKQHNCDQIIFGSYIFGQIYKKSQFFGKWQKRYVVLNVKGVYSYKSGSKKQEYSFFIERDSIQYIWSRFDLVDNHLVIKLKHGLTQTEFAIPIANFSSVNFKNWLYYFYRLMAPNHLT